MLVALGVHKGVDFNIGNKLEDLVRRNGFHKVKTYYHQQKVVPVQIEVILIARLKEWGDEALKANLTTLKEIEQWKMEIRKFSKLKAPHYFATAKQAYILASN